MRPTPPKREGPTKRWRVASGRCGSTASKASSAASGGGTRTVRPGSSARAAGARPKAAEMRLWRRRGSVMRQACHAARSDPVFAIATNLTIARFGEEDLVQQDKARADGDAGIGEVEHGEGPAL